MSMKSKINLIIIIAFFMASFSLIFIPSSIKVNAAETLVNISVFAEQFNNGKGGSFELSQQEGGVSLDGINFSNQISIDLSNYNIIYISTSSNYELDGIYESADFSGEKLTGTLSNGIYQVDLTNVRSQSLFAKLTIKRANVIVESTYDFITYGTGTYLYGSQVMLNCTSINDNVKFSKWVKVIGNLETFLSNNQEYVFIVNGDIRLKPLAKYHFKATTTNGKVNIYENGNLTQEEYFESGTNLTVEAIANKGYKFVDYTDDFAGKEKNFNVTVTTWHSFSAIFESKNVKVEIISNDPINSNLEGSTNTQNVEFSVGDIIIIKANANTKFKLDGWTTNCSGYFNINLANQSYIITPEDAEIGYIYFTANIIQQYAQANLIVYGGGNIKVNNMLLNTGLDKIMEIGDNYVIEFFPNKMYELTKLEYQNLISGEKIDLLEEINSNTLTIDILEDFKINIYYTRILWSNFVSKPNGSGTNSNPYVITSPEELAFIAYSVNNNIKQEDETKINYTTAVYRLEKNIDLSGKYWKKIGTNFRGTIDVNFKTLSGATLENDIITTNFKDLFSGQVNLKRDINTLWTTIGILVSFILAITIVILLIFMNKSKQKIKKVIIVPKDLKKF